MTVSISLLEAADEPAFEHLLAHASTAMPTVSLAYRDFLRRLLPDAVDRYLVAHQGGELIGALPAFLLRHPLHGAVLNSLPFFGSPGGLVIADEFPEPSRVKRALIEAFHALANDERVVTSTIIASALDPDQAFYEAYAPHTLRDERIGQLTPLPAPGGSTDETAERLMERFHFKTRNAIRKSFKSELHCYHDGSQAMLAELARLHAENMAAIGGLAKPWSVFEAIRESCVYDRDYRVYAAAHEGRIVAALLVFFANGVAEYYTPATDAEFRSLQPMSGLILLAMQEAVHRGCRYWNWGGTWLSQGGVYQFKSRWGTEDRPYTYFVHEHVRPSPLRALTRADLLAAYPYFYALPFGVLEDAPK